MENAVTEILYREESYAIIGCCFEVYNDKGSGFLEPVYQECLEIEFSLRQLPVIPKAELKLTYKGRTLEKKYEADFLCFDKIILEIKAVSELVDEHRAQVHNYLKATGFRIGLLVNFGSQGQLHHERIIRSKSG
jgi:GxxExxY protein